MATKPSGSYPPSDIPTAKRGASGICFLIDWMTSKRSSVFAAQYVLAVYKKTI